MRQLKIQERAHKTVTSSAVEINDLHKSYGDVDVLKGVSLHARDGDVISLIGASGSGKSTFLRCINLLELPSAGEIHVGGERILFKGPINGSLVPVDKKQVQRMRTGLGMVFQNFNLWSHMTVLQNVMEAPVHVMGLSKVEAMERAESMLNRVGMWGKRNEYPARISGGQQQRTAIARALAIEPQIMLFDEPTSALDPELVGEVLKVIHGIAEDGRTMILVTHEMKFARDVSSHVIFLDQGVIGEEGTADHVFLKTDNERCRNFVGSVA